MSELDRMIEANRRYAERFEEGGKPTTPARRVAILTCMDSRIHLEQALGLSIGDAHMIRNAGGRASDDAIRSLIISSRLLGTTEFAVIHHTDCGMVMFTNQQLREKLADEAGTDASAIDFLPFSDLRQSVIDPRHPTPGRRDFGLGLHLRRAFRGARAGHAGDDAGDRVAEFRNGGEVWSCCGARSLATGAWHLRAATHDRPRTGASPRREPAFAACAIYERTSGLYLIR
jgi:carbonic anhydrase